MPSSTAKARIRAKAGSGTRRGDGIPRGWPVVAWIPRRYILRPQRDPDAREALNRPMAVRLAQRMLAVPGLLEQSRQGLRRLTGDVQPPDGEALELPRGEGALGGDPARAEQRAEPAEARQDYGPDVSADLELVDRVLHRVGRGVAGPRVAPPPPPLQLHDPPPTPEPEPPRYAPPPERPALGQAPRWCRHCPSHPDT